MNSETYEDVRITLSIRSALQKAHDEIVRIAKKIDLQLNETDITEAIPFLSVVADFATSFMESNKEKAYDDIIEWADLIAKENGKDEAWLSKRILFYSTFIGGRKARGDCLFMKPGELQNNPIGRCFVAFTDVLFNPSCLRNYDEAPALIRGFSQTADIALQMKEMLIPVQALVSTIANLKPSISNKAITRGRNNENQGNAIRHHWPEEERSSLKEYTAESKHRFRKVLGVVFVVIVLFISGSHLYKEFGLGDASLKPINVYSGKIIIRPDYDQVCPLEIQSSSDSNYYIFLDYKGKPSRTTVQRKKFNNSSGSESDMAFYVGAGQTVKVYVPVGNYDLFYATGTTFYGPKDLFGNTTQCYKADSVFEFYADSQSYLGHTVTLYTVPGGNLDTDTIPEFMFPTK